MLGVGLSSTSGATVISLVESIRSNFAKKVVKNGGTVADNSCLLTHLDALTKRDPDVDILRAFEARVALDGGAFDCTSGALDGIEDLTTKFGTDRILVENFRQRVYTNGGTIENISLVLTELAELT